MLLPRSDGPSCRGGMRWAGPAGLFLAAVLVSTAVGASSTLYLCIRCAPLRSEPSLANGDTKTTVFLNQELEVVEHSKDKDWVKVRFTGGNDEQPRTEEGWIHATVLADRPAYGERDKECAWLREGAAALPPVGTASKGQAERRRGKLEDISGAERLFPSPEELDRFLKDGCLGLHRTDWPSLEGGVTE